MIVEYRPVALIHEISMRSRYIQKRQQDLQVFLTVRSTCCLSLPAGLELELQSFPSQPGSQYNISGHNPSSIRDILFRIGFSKSHSVQTFTMAYPIENKPRMTLLILIAAGRL